jgi:beta-glucosidase
MVPGTWGALSDRHLTPEEVEAEAKALLARLTLDEKIHQMSGDTPLLSGAVEMVRAYNVRPLPAGENHRLGIPGIRFTDGPRGVVMYRSTCFPAAIGRGASWDVDLEERIGDAIGVEARAQGANLFAGVCINLLRHPAWGRAQETYGEEPHALGEMGAAMIRGVQRHVMACVKHFAANSIENTRFKVDVRMAPRTLHEVYLPHFRRCVDEGVASVMSAYNRLNGTYCGHHRELLYDILKKEWGFDGFVMSDFMFGIRGADAAATGMDLEMPFTWRFGRRLKRAVAKGRVAESHLDDAVLRLLRQKARFASVGAEMRYDRALVAGVEHRALARESAQKSITLLQNNRPADGSDPILPIHLGSVDRIAVIGKLATKPNLGDLGSSRVRPPHVVTVMEGLGAAVRDPTNIEHHPGDDTAGAAELAARSDIAIVLAGYGPRDEGEKIPRSGGDRQSLSLHSPDEALIQAVAARNPRCVVVMIGGSAIVTESWRERVPALVMAWYPGMEGGHAIADVLLGRVNPSGRLPCVFPRSEEQLPFFDPKARSIEYGFLHGQRWLDANGAEPAFPLGFGLGYTTFAYAGLEIDQAVISADGSFTARVQVTNTGRVAGDEVVQLYVGCEGSRVERAERVLKGFRRISLQPGERQRVDLPVAAHDLAFYDESRRCWEVEPIRYTIQVGPCADARQLLSACVDVRG